MHYKSTIYSLNKVMARGIFISQNISRSQNIKIDTYTYSGAQIISQLDKYHK